MEEQKFTLIKEIYKPSDSSITFMLPILICVVTGIITVYYIIQIELNSSKLDWSKNKCLPKYMFVSGFIKKEENLGVLGSIDKNFKRCVNNVNNDNNKIKDVYKNKNKL